MFNLSFKSLVRLCLVIILGIFSIFFTVSLAYAENNSADQTNFNLSVQTEVGEINIKAENNDLPGNEKPKFEISKNYSAGLDGLGQITTTFINSIKGIITDDPIHEIRIEAIYKATSESVYSQTISYETVPNEIEIANSDLLPGAYTLKLTDITSGTTITQDFTWGVLAINTNKSIYLPDETVKLSIAVLNEKGRMVCSAKLNLTITDPNGKSTILSTEKGDIKISDTCNSKDYTLVPDYYTTYRSNTIGTYKIDLSAETENGLYQINDAFEVKNEVDFEVERLTATRLYPQNDYPVIFTIKANKDYEGIVEEKATSKLAVYYLTNSQLKEKFNLENDIENGIIRTIPGYNDGSEKTLRWQVSWKKGETYHIAYYIDPPTKSPDLFLLGPLKVGSFEEARKWQLANDDTTTKTWVFASDAEGITDQGNSAWITFAYDATDQAVKFTCTRKNLTNEIEYVQIYPPSADTWETWGVPSGGTVTGIQITAWTEKTVANTYLNAHSILARVITGTGATIVHTPTDLLNVSLATTADSSYQSGSAGSSAAVNSSYQASNTQVRLIMYYTLTTANQNTPSVDQRFDNIELTITYTPPAAGDTLTGKAYTDDTEGTALATTSICVAINSNHNVADCNTTDGTGTFTINTASQTNANDQLTFFIDGGTNFGNTITKATGNNIASGANLRVYQNHVIVRYETGSSLTIADMDAYDNSSGGNSTDMLFDATDSTTDTLTVEDTYELFIPSGFVFAPAGNLDNGSGTGIDDIKIVGTYTAASSETILVSGSWVNSGTFTASTSTVTFDAPGATTETINSTGAATASFNNVIFSGNASATFQLSSAFDVNGNLTITTGILNTNTQNINLAGNFDNDAAMTMTSGNFTFDAQSGTKTIDADGTGNEAFYNIIFDDTPGNAATFQMSTLLDADNNLTITGGNLDVNGSNQITVGGNWDNDDTFTSSTGTVTLNATSGTKTIDALGTGTSSFNDFTINDNGNSATFQLTTAIDINGTFNLTDGIFQQNGANNITTAGVVSIGSGATYTKSSGTWTFDGTGSANYTDSTGTQNIGDVTIDAASATRTVSLQSATVMDNLTIAADGVLAMGTQNVTIGNTTDASHGDINITSGGTTSQSSGTVTILSNSGTTSWNGSGTLTAYNLTIGNGTTFTIDNDSNDVPIDLGGTFTIYSGAIFTSSSTAGFEVAGSWSDSGTFTPGSGTSLVKLNAISGTPTITTTGSSFNYLEIDDTSNNIIWTLQDAMDVNGNLTITGGTLDTGTNRQVNVGGTFTNNDTFTANSGTVVMDGTSGSITGTSNTAFSNLTIDPTSAGTVTLTTSDPSISATLSVASGDVFSLSVNRTVTLGASSTLTLTGTISGSGTLVYQSSNNFPTTGNISSLLRFDAQNGNHTLPQRTNGYEGHVTLYNNSGIARTFNFAAGGSQTLTFSGNLTLNAPSGAIDISSSNNPAVNISGNLAGTAGGSAENITTGTGTWTVTGSVDLTNIGTFTATGGTFQMNGSTTSLTSAGESFNNFNVTGGSPSTTDSMIVSGNFNVTSGSFTHASGNMTVSGTFTLTSGSFTHGAGADIDILVGGNFTLQTGTTWVENTTSSSQLILTGDLTYDDNTAGIQSVGNVQIGNSPGTTYLSSDMSANSLTVTTSDYYYTCGWEVDIGNGGITIDGTFNATRTAGGCSSDTDQTIINDLNLFNLSGTGTFVPDQSKIIFDDSSGTNNLTTAGTGSFYDMEINGAANTMLLKDALDVDNDLTITQGTLDVESGNSWQINVGGDWTNDGTFNELSGKVVFDGTSSVNLDSGCADAGTCTTQNFYDLEINKTNGDANDNVTLLLTDLRLTNTLTITYGELIQGTLDVRVEGASAVSVASNGKWTNTSTGDLTLGGSFANSGTVTFQGNGVSCGDTNTDLVIASTTTTQRSWTSSGGTFNFNDASVSWQGGTASITDYNGFSGGNNDTNWSFGGCPVNVTGYVYDFGTSNRLSECNGSSNTLQLRASGNTYSTSCSASDGYYAFNSIAGPSSGDGLVIWIDHDVATTAYGAMVVRYDGTGASDNNVFYDDAVTVTSDDTTGVDIDDFNFYDNGNDGDIPFTANNATPDTLSVNSGFELYVLKKSTVASGSTVLDPNGTVSTNSTGGDLHIGVNSKAYLDTGTNSIGRDVEVDGGATLDFNATTTIGGGDITTAGTSATVSSTTGNPTVTISGTGNIGGGTNPSITLYNFETSGSGTTSITSTFNVDNDLTVGNGTTLDVKADLFVNGGDLTTTGTASVTTTSGTPEVNITGSGVLGGGSNTMTFYDLTIDGITSTTPNSTIDVVNALTVGDGTNAATFQVNTNDKQVSTLDLEIKVSGVYSASSDALYPLTVSRNFTNNGSFSANGGKTVFDSTNTSILTYSGATTFFQLTVNTPQKIMKFSSSNQTNITDTLILQGTGCTTNRVFLDSDDGSSSWNINATGSTKTLEYVNVKNSNAVSAITANNSTNGGNNSGSWVINGGVCGGGGGANEVNVRGNINVRGGVRIK